MVCCVAFLVGCDLDRSAGVQSNQSKFELQKDPQGRTIRLNKITGEVVVVDGTQLIPVQRADGPTARTSPTSKPAAHAPAAKPAAIPEPVPQTVAINVDSPVFVNLSQRQTPLMVLRKGSTVTVLGREGSWYRVEFENPTLGHKVGYIAKGNTLSVSPTYRDKMQPVDLSIHEPKTQSDQPVDLSIPEAKPGRLEPTDLSIKDPK
jgi:hypothetical protein